MSKPDKGQKTSRFLLNLLPYEEGRKKYDGCRRVTQDAYSPDQAITEHLFKVRHMNFADHYLTAFESGLPDAYVWLVDGNQNIILNYIDKRLKTKDGIRKEAKEMGMPRDKINELSYGQMLKFCMPSLWRDIKSVSEVAKLAVKTTEQHGQQYELF
jgi:hypothetical protein